MKTKSKPRFGVVASIVESNPSKFKQAMMIAQTAHSCEIRLDPLLPRFSEFAPLLTECLTTTSTSKWTILTLRSKGQGGSEHLTLRDQWDFWKNLPSPIMKKVNAVNSKILIDWDISLIFYVTQEVKLPPPFPWSQIGSSLHDFSGTPRDLGKRLQLLEQTKAQAFMKFITTIRNSVDEESIRHLFDQRTDPRPLIAFGMGIQGQNSRRSCLGWGSAATYGCLPGRAKGAPGQISIVELLDDPAIRSVFQE